MYWNSRMRAVLTVSIVSMAAGPLAAQGAPGPQDPGMTTARRTTPIMKTWLTKAGKQMTEEDFAYRPAPDVRTFGQLLAHVTDLNNLFCSSAIGEQSPLRGLEKSATTSRHTDGDGPS